ncbi:MAG: ASKHA domain-containing protein [Treponema sp.]|jgi:uncharacterized 2Fe-2S/4Fe-4S cluster protein (DUF4445 family)|nr:ASKHA domain-containing protein [Treponema sp.]
MKIRLQGGSFTGEAAVFDALAGETLLEVFRRAGVSMDAPCGGQGRCGKCRVKILEGSTGGESPEAGGMVRSCRAVPLGDLLIEIPPAARLRKSPAGLPRSGNISRAGIALDIGTTTVSARIINMETGEVLDTLSALNEQRIYGADVMSRIGTAREGRTGELYRRINDQCRSLIDILLENRGPGIAAELVVAANTTMLHLFTNTDPSAMGEIPFKPVFLEERKFSGTELDLPVETVRLLPSISAFVGADIVSGIAFLGMCGKDESSLLIDMGTNGEIALFNKGRIYCCSTAAGPALEGAGISCGMGSIDGAINRITVKDGETRIETINGAEAAGICGSGLIDAVALMLEKGVIDETGAFVDEGQGVFPITGTIGISGADIRAFQLAKSAIISGIKILCKSAGLSPEDVNRIYVAGGLGFYIDQESAFRTGLLPSQFRDRITVSGNTSLAGAEYCLESPGFMDQCRNIVAMSEVIELATIPEFMYEFSENILFE